MSSARFFSELFTYENVEGFNVSALVSFSMFSMLMGGYMVFRIHSMGGYDMVQHLKPRATSSVETDDLKKKQTRKKRRMKMKKPSRSK
ncbi:unnamed protein product [Caenorhabditis sp. 36 PRJEB53466]|nr:unnamed protein product [Caenorhabditis sp. 36 PRJEB53466]